jgi:peptidyl-prolyl cis-trans isomerase A (cyclophilin A)
MNSALPFTFAWNGFSVGSPVNLQSAYFTINRVSDGQVAYSSVQGNGAGSATILKNTLQPNTAYNATLIYDARIENFNAGFNGATSEVAFDQRVNLAFATGAIPEPSSIILAVLGLACVAIWPRRSRMFVLCAVAALCSPRISEAGTIVSFDFTNFGQVQVELFDSDAPLTVANFLTYVTGGRYNDTMIHRVDTGLGVVQGGGFTKTAGPIPTDPAIPLEYSHPNARGTLAMARTSSPNTATSQWYFNTHDNSTLLGPSNGGGYAVFGQVLGSGMDVIDAIFSVPTFAYNQPFSQVPLQNFSTTDFNNGADPIPHVVVLHSVTVVPEPSSFALAAIGLIGWLVLRRRALPAN